MLPSLPQSKSAVQPNLALRNGAAVDDAVEVITNKYPNSLNLTVFLKKFLFPACRKIFREEPDSRAWLLPSYVSAVGASLTLLWSTGMNLALLKSYLNSV